MNVTNRQLISLVLLTITLGILLALLPDQPAGSSHSGKVTKLAVKTGK